MFATLSAFVTDANGDSVFGVGIPPLPSLAGLESHETAPRIDPAGSTPFPVIGNVATFVIQ